MSQLLPRIRGSAIPKGRGWTWEMFITIGPETPENQAIKMSPKDAPPFLTREGALADLRASAAQVLPLVCEAMSLPKPEAVLDLLAGEQKTMEEFVAPLSYGPNGGAR